MKDGTRAAAGRPGSRAETPRARSVFVASMLVLAVTCATSAASGPQEIEVFTREGCPRCAEAARFLDELRREAPEVRIVVHDVGRDADARARLADRSTRRGMTRLLVPAFLIGEELLVGFRSGVTDHELRVRLGLAPPSPPRAADDVDTGRFGVLSVDRLGLPLFTIALGLVDGFNPCAMFMLLFVLALLANLRDRARMALVGGTFVAVSGLAYFAFMAAWLNVFLAVGYLRWIEVVLGLVAVAIGGLNVKDFFAFRHGPSVGIPAAAKPRLYARVRAIVQAESLAAALGGAIVLAILVNVVELLCTAGLPVIYTRILSLRDLPAWQYYAYLALYNVAYVADDAAMLGVAVATLGSRKLREREGRWLKLVSGLVLIGLGVALVLGRVA